MDEVCIFGVARKHELITVWEKRIEGLNAAVVQVNVTGCCFNLQAESGRPEGILRVAEQRANRPCPNRLFADFTRLKHRLYVPISSRDFPRISQVKYIAMLLTLRINELCTGTRVKRITSR